MTEQQKLFDLLRAGVTPFMCVKECERRLTEAGFEKINYEIDRYYKSSRLSTGSIPPFSRLFINLGNSAASAR